jgi:hypothetical protein
MENILRYKKSKKPKKSKKAKKSAKHAKILPQKRNQTRKQQSRVTLADSSQTNKPIYL